MASRTVYQQTYIDSDIILCFSNPRDPFPKQYLPFGSVLGLLIVARGVSKIEIFRGSLNKCVLYSLQYGCPDENLFSSLKTGAFLPASTLPSGTAVGYYPAPEHPQNCRERFFNGLVKSHTLSYGIVCPIL